MPTNIITSLGFGVITSYSIHYTKLYDDQADAASRRALELAPDLPEVHVSRGLALAFSRRFAEAETEFRAAIILNPKLYEAHYS